MHTMKRVLKIGNEMKVWQSVPYLKCHPANFQIQGQLNSLQQAFTSGKIG